MGRRHFTFLLALVGTMLSGVVIALLLLGVVGSTGAQTEALLAESRARAADRLGAQLGDVSMEAVLLSESVAESIADMLAEEGLAPKDLQGRPELLEGILSRQLAALQLSLERSGASGAFIVLDATVNPGADAAAHSRAGLYIRRPEPNVAGDKTTLYLRGFPQIATAEGLSFQSMWDLEFDIQGRRYWQIPLEAAGSHPGLPPSRLYWWGFDDAVDNLGENTLLCSIPLVGEGDAAFGVCGFEISAEHFRLYDAPEVAGYPGAALCLSEGGADAIGKSASLHAGSAKLFPEGGGSASLSVVGREGALDIYGSGAGAAEYVGLSGNIRLYAEGSPFAEGADGAFAATLLVPKADVDKAAARETRRLVLLFALLLAVGTVASVVLNRRFMKPIEQYLQAIEAGEAGAVSRFPELEAIVGKMAALKGSGEPITADLFGGFIRSVRKLTPTERVIFDYYADGKTAEEIRRFMYISNPTLKTHNRHIYEKLGVSSRDEMLLYVALIKKSGLESEISSLG
ncbi:MAG: LuxR C-terminal-related transcriptional regulator [Clostridiales Family XIII bacterium]|jgi:DNA-binding CsgD family transcriptional regulator|nr:LuxR C-terminal-related transcriptional regulator [Clostridiales Family XIII bacterium]